MTSIRPSRLMILLSLALPSCKPDDIVDDFRSVRARVEGTVVSAVDQRPASGRVITILVPLSVQCSGESYARTEPAPVVSGNDGKFAATMLMFAVSPREYCVSIVAAGVTAGGSKVRFRYDTEAAIDTVRINVVVP